MWRLGARVGSKLRLELAELRELGIMVRFVVTEGLGFQYYS